jgi:hypothetical protein
VIDIRVRQREIAVSLLRWAVPSVVLGALGLLVPVALVRGIALHALAWGGIDALLAVAGLAVARRDGARYPDEYRDVTTTLRLRRILRLNGILDIFYIIGGAAVVVLFRHDPFYLGNGIGVLIQAFFLLFFDWIQFLRLPQHAPSWYDPAP